MIEANKIVHVRESEINKNEDKRDQKDSPDITACKVYGPHLFQDLETIKTYFSDSNQLIYLPAYDASKEFFNKKRQNTKTASEDGNKNQPVDTKKYGIWKRTRRSIAKFMHDFTGKKEVDFSILSKAVHSKYNDQYHKPYIYDHESKNMSEIAKKISEQAERLLVKLMVIYEDGQEAKFTDALTGESTSLSNIKNIPFDLKTKLELIEVAKNIYLRLDLMVIDLEKLLLAYNLDYDRYSEYIDTITNSHLRIIEEHKLILSITVTHLIDDVMKQKDLLLLKIKDNHKFYTDIYLNQLSRLEEFAKCVEKDISMVPSQHIQASKDLLLKKNITHISEMKNISDINTYYDDLLDNVVRTAVRKKINNSIYYRISDMNKEYDNILNSAINDGKVEKEQEGTKKITKDKTKEQQEQQEQVVPGASETKSNKDYEQGNQLDRSSNNGGSGNGVGDTPNDQTQRKQSHDELKGSKAIKQNELKAAKKQPGLVKQVLTSIKSTTYNWWYQKTLLFKSLFFLTAPFTVFVLYLGYSINNKQKNKNKNKIQSSTSSVGVGNGTSYTNSAQQPLRTPSGYQQPFRTPSGYPAVAPNSMPVTITPQESAIRDINALMNMNNASLSNNALLSKAKHIKYMTSIQQNQEYWEKELKDVKEELKRRSIVCYFRSVLL